MPEQKLSDLKAKSPADLLALAEELEVEAAASMRKQDMMFAILKEMAEEGTEIIGSRRAGGAAGRLRLPALGRRELSAGAGRYLL